MYGSSSPVSMDTGLLLLSIVGLVTMSTACPTLCQCNLDYFVYCKNIPLGEAQLKTVMAEMPKQVRLLDLGFNGISNLPADIFSDLPHLKTLNLESNKITQIPDSAFQNLPNLIELSLNNNVLNQLTVEPWRKIPNLKKLDLEDNYIDYVAPLSFVSLTNLTELNLRSNQIGVLERRTFTGLSSLVSLDVSNNIIQRIDNGTFQDLSRLVTLDLSYNMLSEVNSGTFSGLIKLDTLILDYNEISDLQGLAHASFRPSLKKLHVSHNNLTFIPAGLFDNFNYLRELHLDFNNIQTIARSPFIGMTLDRLSVSNNKLTALQRDMFGQIQRIKKLDFSYNRIRSLSTGVFDSFRESVHEVRLEGNKLLYIDPGHFRGMIHIRCLNLSDNLISIIKDKSFADLHELEDLVLSGNDLEKVTPAILSGINLQRLFLICNPLKQFSGFRYDDTDNPNKVHMNLTVIEQTDVSLHVRWPYTHGSQIYWTLKLWCLDREKCSETSKEEYLAPFKTEYVVEDLLPNTAYYLCINPIFVNKDVHIEQCIKISSMQGSLTTSTTIQATEPLTSGRRGDNASLIVILTVLLLGSFTHLH